MWSPKHSGETDKPKLYPLFYIQGNCEVIIITENYMNTYGMKTGRSKLEER